MGECSVGRLFSRPLDATRIRVEKRWQRGVKKGGRTGGIRDIFTVMGEGRNSKSERDTYDKKKVGCTQLTKSV